MLAAKVTPLLNSSSLLRPSTPGLVQQQQQQQQPLWRQHALAASASLGPPWCRLHACSCRPAPVACQAAGKQQQQQPQQPSGKQQQSQQQQQDDMSDVIMIDDDDDLDDFGDEFDEFEDEDGEDDGFLDGDDEDTGLLPADSESDPGPAVLTGNVTWGDAALRVAEAVLARPENANLSLYLFRAIVPSKTVEVRLDRLDDVYGSPDVDDIERFSRAMMQGLEAELGPEEAGTIGFEVSSPGAERTLIIPTDLERFKELPMRVEFMSEVGQLTTLVLRFLDLDQAADSSSWELADVKANQAVKGRGLSKKQRAQRYTIRLSELERVRIYIDF